MVKIEFFKGIIEPTPPMIRLTKSKNGKTGTATFLFFQPKVFSMSNTEICPINGMFLTWNQKKIFTNDIEIFFSHGKPFLIKSILIFKNSNEWFDFLSFMSFYSKETGLSFLEKNSSF